MRQIAIEDFKQDVDQLLESVTDGDDLVVTRDGKALVRIVAESAICGEGAKPFPFGFMQQRSIVPDDFDKMGADEIRRMFEGE
jgi:antitoxin (DNA-binding transcriptional repressor) of toxin-antitoxin stability system